MSSTKNLWYLVFVALFFLIAKQLSAQPKTTFQGGHTGAVSIMERSPDDLWVASGGDDGKVLIWDINTRSILFRLEKHFTSIDDIVFHPSKPWLASIDGSGEIIIWDINDGEVIREFLITSQGPVEKNEIKERYGYNPSPSAGRIFGGKLIFMEDKLLVGDGFPQEQAQSSLFSIGLNDTNIKAFTGMPKDKYAAWYQVEQMTALNEQEILLLLKPSTDDYELSVFNLETNKVTNTIDKREDLASFAYNPVSNIVATENESSNETRIYQLPAGKLTSKLQFTGSMAWEKDLLWLSHLETLRSYNSLTGKFENQLPTNFSGDQLLSLPKHGKILHLSRFNGMTFIDPIYFNELAETGKFMGTDKYDYNKVFVQDIGFLNENSLLIKSSESGDYHNDHFRWTLDESAVVPLFDYQESADLYGIDRMRNTIIGLDFDSTSVETKYFGLEDQMTIDMVDLSSSEPKVSKSYDHFQFLGIQEDFGIILAYQELGDANGNVHVIDYLSEDTLQSFTNIPSPYRGFYDPISENLCLAYADNSRTDELRLEFYNSEKSKGSSFHKIQFDKLSAVDFDGKRRLLISTGFNKGEVVNISFPEKTVRIAGFDLDVAVLHPYEPWIFTASDELNLNGIICYDYAQKIYVGGISIEEFQSKDYLAPVEHLAINRSGTKIAAHIGTNKIKMYGIRGLGKQNTLDLDIEPITDFTQSGSYLHLEQRYFGSHIINLQNLKPVKNLLEGLELNSTNKPSGIKYVAIKSEFAKTYYLKTLWDYSSFPSRAEYILEEEVINLRIGTATIEQTTLNIEIDENLNVENVIDDRYVVLYGAINSWQKRIYYNGLWVYDLHKNKIILEKPDLNYDGLFFNQTRGKYYFYSNQHLSTWEVGSQELSQIDISPDYLSMPNQMDVEFFPNEGTFLKSEMTDIIQFDLATGTRIDSISVPEKLVQVGLFQKLQDDQVWVTGYSVIDTSYVLAKLHVSTNAWETPFTKIPDQALATELSENGKNLLVSLANGAFQIRDADSGELLSSFLLKNTGEMYITDAVGNFHSSNVDFEPYKLQRNGLMFSSRYLQQEKNRPDLLIEKLNYAEEEMMEVYREAVEKRQFIMPKSEVSISESVPYIVFDNVPSNFTSDTDRLVLEGTLHAETPSDFSHIDVVVNGQMRTVAIEDTANLQLPVALRRGGNFLSFSLRDEAGQHYPAQELNLISLKKREQGNLIITVLGVSNYQDSIRNLTYATKDAKDMIQVFRQQGSSYKSIITHSLLNEKVTVENIDSLFSIITPNANDKLVFFLAGHGLLDERQDFFFGTYDIDFDNPGKRGLSFNYLQDKIAALPSAEKLLLIDACHSGLTDKSKSNEKIENQEGNEILSLENAFARRGAQVSSSSRRISLQSSFELMQELFSNFSSFSGTETITAASGDSWALESPQWKNGAFTFVLKKGLLNYEADLDGNGSVSIAELKRYVKSEVTKLTSGRQKPTSRDSNKYLNWDLWN
jgi:WD40 repeat protein